MIEAWSGMMDDGGHPRGYEDDPRGYGTNFKFNPRGYGGLPEGAPVAVSPWVFSGLAAVGTFVRGVSYQK